MKLMGTQIDGDITKKYYADEEGNLVIDQKQNPYEVLKRIEEIRENPWTEDKSMKHVASVPLVVIQAWRKEGIDIYNKDHAHLVKAKLNSAEFRAFRTGGGNL